MKKLVYSIAAMIAMLCTACDHYDHAIADQGDRLDILEKSTIKNIDEQVTAINTSLEDLEDVDTSLKTLIDELGVKATDLQAKLDTNSIADAETKRALQEELDNIETLIESLQNKDTELDQKISDLKTYAESYTDDQITSTKNWAENTFATLEQYKEMQDEISDIKTLIETYKTDITSAYTTAISNAITDVETSMKTWVNTEFAANYYKISEIDALLSALDTKIGDSDEALKKAIEDHKTDLNNLSSTLTEAYKTAIQEAITNNNGQISQDIADAVNAATAEFNTAIAAINTDIDDIKNRLGVLEDTVEDLVARIQSIRFLPEYSDGKVELNSETTLTFILSPKDAAAAIAEAAKDNNNIVKAYVSRTKVRTKSADMPVSLTVTSVEGNSDGILKVGVSDYGMPSDYWKDIREGNIYINISDGNNDIISEMIPILPMSYISTEEAFLAALNGAKTTGGVVRLSSDIALEEPIALSTGDDVTIDLNGHTISTESSQTGKNFDMFDVNKGSVLTVKNGTLTTKHNVNMGWSQSTNVFNVTAGGVLNIENATIKNLGGSDMAFCIHLNNWGEVTLNVNNSTLESTYMAVRVFNSGPYMNNVTIKNSNLKGNNYCFWVHNYTIEDFGTQDKVDSQKALLNLDIYNNNNNFDCGVAAARFGFTNAELYDGTGAKVVADVVGLEKAIKAGGEFRLVKDIALTKSIAVNNVDFVLDGNGKTITMAAGASNPIALFDITSGKATIKNVTFDGIKGGAIVRTVGVEFTADNVTAKNSAHTQSQGLFRLYGNNQLQDCVFEKNSCDMVVSFNFDHDTDNLGEYTEPSVISNCKFEENTCKTIAIVYYATGSAATIDNSKFLNNSLNITTNGATVYLGFKKNCTVTNNIFKDNKVTTTSSSKRVAGALMVGNNAVITGNAFIDNEITSPNTGMANDVCASVYYSAINLSGNYWGGNAPVENDDYFVEYPDKNQVIITDFLTTYEGL